MLYNVISIYVHFYINKNNVFKSLWKNIVCFVVLSWQRKTETERNHQITRFRNKIPLPHKQIGLSKNRMLAIWFVGSKDKLCNKGYELWTYWCLFPVSIFLVKHSRSSESKETPLHLYPWSRPMRSPMINNWIVGSFKAKAI